MQTQISTADLQACLPALQRFAVQLTRDADRAGDLVQDTIERALRKAHLFDGSNLKSWLFTICRRVFLNQIRSAKAKGTSVDLESVPQSFVSANDSQEQVMHYNDVATAFERLPLNDKIILSLIVMEGMKYEEAATLLEVPVGTVRSRLSRARTRLFEMVEGAGAEQGTKSAARV